jgi:hypothetical protein
LNETCPDKLKMVNNKKNASQPLMTKGLIKSANRCGKLYKESIGRDKNDVIVINYKRYRNLFNKIKIKSKIKYYNTKIQTFKNDSKKLWKVYNSLLGKINNKKETIDFIKWDNVKI